MSTTPSPGESNVTRTGRWSFLDSNQPQAFSGPLMFGIATACLLLAVVSWLWLRDRTWPENSFRDMGGMGLVLIACGVGAASLLLPLRWSWLAAFPSLLALSLLGHVGPQSGWLLVAIGCSTTGFIAMVRLSLEPVARVAQASESIASSSVSLSPSALAPLTTESPNAQTPSTDDSQLTEQESEAESEPTTKSESSNDRPFAAKPLSELEARLLARAASARADQEPMARVSQSSLAETESDSGEECTEEELSEEDSSVTQSWKRWSSETQEFVSGFVTVEFEPQAQVAWIHIPFWPPLSHAPQVEFPVDASVIRVKATQTEAYGIRAEVKLAGRSSISGPVRVEFIATADRS